MKHRMLILMLLVASGCGLGLIAAAAPLPLADLKGMIVFAREFQGQWDIWAIRANGTGLTRLTDDPAKDADPTWSPDGAKILYASLRDGISRVVRMNQDGSNPEVICDGQNPAWCPDGAAIVLVRDGEVIWRRLADGQERRLTPELWDRCAHPVVAPAGDRIVCSSRHGKIISIYLVPLVGGEDEAKTRQVVTDKEACTPCWRSDGRRLLYQTSRHIFEIEPDTGKPNDQLTFGGDIQSHARYSPDGKMIVFNRAPGEAGPWTLQVLDLETEAEAVLPIEGSALYPDWKADAAASASDK